MQHFVDCLKEKNYFEGSCKSFADFFTCLSLQGLHVWIVLFQEIHKSAEVDSGGRSHVIWISCGVF